MARWKRFTGTGVCDVCLRPVQDCKNVYEVPNDIFYSSKKYRERVSELAAAYGMSGDQYLARIRAMDVSTCSAVCDQCIGLFENNAVVPDRNQQGNTNGRVSRAANGGTETREHAAPEKANIKEGLEKPVEEKAVPPVQPAYIVNAAAVGEKAMPKADDAVSEKKTLRRFPKGWVIAMIVVTSCAVVVVLPLLGGSGSELALLALSFLGSIITGYALMLRKKALGFWIALIGNILLLLMNRVRIGNSILMITFGLPLIIISFFITMRQIDYRFWKYIKSPQSQAQASKPELPVSAPVIEAPKQEQRPIPDAPKSHAATSPKKQNIPIAAKNGPALKKERVASKTEAAAPARPGRRANWYVIGGITAFVVIIGVVLYFGLFSSNAQSTRGEAPPVRQENQAPAVAASPIQTSKPSVEEERILADIESKLSEQIQEAAKQATDSALFHAAVENVKISNPVFSEYSVTVTVVLPDPSIESLRKLNIAPYVPFSGAQSYIKENYQSLKRVNTLTDSIGFEVALYYQNTGSNTKEIDTSFPHGTVVIMEYSDIFEPHMDQYMTELGFYAAAQEILLPDFQQWENHTGAVSDPGFLDAYFKSAAEALAFKGIDYKGKVIVDTVQIEQLLHQRFAQCWAYDRLSVETERYRSSSLKFNAFNHGAFFYEIVQRMDAQYESGAAVRPASYDALEQEFMAMVKKQVNSSFGELAKSMSAETWEGDYRFEWEKLGDEGIAACPDFIDRIRSFMDSYDSHLGILAHPDLL